MSDSTVVGFTPINARIPHALLEPNKRNRKARSDASASNTIGGANQAAKSVASAYLGRDNPREETEYEARSKPRKRKITSSEQANTKRRRGKDGGESIVFHQNQFSVPENRLAKPNTNLNDVIGPDSDAVRYLKTSNVDGKDPPLQLHAPQTTKANRSKLGRTAAESVSVYAPYTSMTSMASSGHKTVLEAVRTSTKTGYTAYNSCKPADTALTEVEFAPHWPIDTISEVSGRKLQASHSQRKLSEEDFTGGDEIDIEVLQSIEDGEGQGFLPTGGQINPTAVNTLPTPASSDFAAPGSGPGSPDAETWSGTPQNHCSGLFQEGEEAITPPVRQYIKEVTPPPRDRRRNIRDVDPNEDYGGALLSEVEQQRLAASTTKRKGGAKWFVRMPFPPPLLDRSPIFGASSTTTLRVCFRIGEALNAGFQALSTSKDVLLELYARVSSSWRENQPSRKQHFEFRDLYHDNPPHLNGILEGYDRNQLWDLDSKPFLVPRQEGVVCRTVGKMRRDGGKWRLEVLSIWEATWEDVGHVSGIYSRNGTNVP